jgi:hypothetical protein
MNPSAIKKRIISKLNEVDNAELLQAVYTILETNSTVQEEYTLTPGQEKELRKRMASFKSGKSKTYSWKEAETLIRKSTS